MRVLQVVVDKSCIEISGSAIRSNIDNCVGNVPECLIPECLFPECQIPECLMPKCLTKLGGTKAIPALFCTKKL